MGRVFLCVDKGFRLVENLEQSEATVLLAGESGTGKEVLARAIHGRCPRRSGPFVGVNCGVLPGKLPGDARGLQRTI